MCLRESSLRDRSRATRAFTHQAVEASGPAGIVSDEQWLMKVTEHLDRANEPLVSFEIIPPKRGGVLADVLDLMEDLAQHRPAPGPRGRPPRASSARLAGTTLGVARSGAARHPRVRG